MEKSRFSKRLVIALFFLMSFIFIGLGIWAQPNVKAKADEVRLSVKIENTEWLENANTVIFYLTETDFITAAFDETLNTAEKYKWVDLTPNHIRYH